MSTTTPSQPDWMQNNEPDSMEELEDLWNAANRQESVLYKIGTTPRGALLITAPSGETLLLATPQAEANFKKLLQERSPDPDLDIPSAAAMHRALEKDKD